MCCYFNQVYLAFAKKVVGIGMEREAHFFIIIKFILMFNPFPKLQKKQAKRKQK